MRYKLIGLAIAAILSFRAPPSIAAEIPLGTTGGIYSVPVQINRSLTMQFLVDPGAGVVVIPLRILQNLMETGTVTQSDIVGVGTAETADNTQYLTARVRLRELRVGDVVAQDVTAAVAPGLVTPLLGQSFFRRFAYVTFDNRRNVMILSDDKPPALAGYPSSGWPAPYSSYPPSAPLGGGGYGYYGYSPGSGR